MENYYSIEFRLEREKRYLVKNPTLAITLALNYLEDFLNLARKFKVLEQKNKTLEQRNQSLLVDNQLLTSQLIEISSSTGETTVQKRNSSRMAARIPSFLNCQKH